MFSFSFQRTRNILKSLKGTPGSSILISIPLYNVIPHMLNTAKDLETRHTEIKKLPNKINMYHIQVINEDRI
jgi:hypothetical protein